MHLCGWPKMPRCCISWLWHRWKLGPGWSWSKMVTMHTNIHIVDTHTQCALVQKRGHNPSHLIKVHTSLNRSCWTSFHQLSMDTTGAAEACTWWEKVSCTTLGNHIEAVNYTFTLYFAPDLRPPAALTQVPPFLHAVKNIHPKNLFELCLWTSVNLFIKLTSHKRLESVFSKSNSVWREYVAWQISCAPQFLVQADIFYSAHSPVCPSCINCLPALRRRSSASHTVSQQDRSLSDCLHTHHSTDSCLTHQTTMAVRDAASLLVGLLVLFHTWGGEWLLAPGPCNTRVGTACCGILMSKTFLF